MYLCALSGVDGAGKSTMARDLASLMLSRGPDLRIAVLWLRYSPRRQSDPPVSSTVATAHRGHPLKRALIRVGLRRVWVAANTSAYRRQLELQLLSVKDADFVIADRFTLDFAADQIAAGALRTSEARDVVSALPLADTYRLVTVPDRELVLRLKPGDAAAEVVRRSRLYVGLADSVGIPTVDGRDVAELHRLVEEIERGIARRENQR